MASATALCPSHIPGSHSSGVQEVGGVPSEVKGAFQLLSLSLLQESGTLADGAHWQELKVSV